MRTIILTLASAGLFATHAGAAMHVTVEGITPGAPIPEKYALCRPTDDGKSKGGDNVRPTIGWSGAPSDTQSFAVVVTDPDVPADFTDAGKDGKVVKRDAKRQLFYHWALADIPATTHEIPGGPSYEAPEMGMAASGSLEKYVDNPTQYGGPCPPWNDERVHTYHFTVYALDVAQLKLPKDPTAAQVEAAAKKHAKASASVIGTYTLNKALRP
jgi:hypothetical protein